MITPALPEFLKLAKHGNVVPVYAEIPADLETPVSAYLKTETTFSFLLESVEGGENLARYSFIGSNPFLIFSAKNNQITIEINKKKKKLNGDPIEELKQIMKQYKPVITTDLPRFHGGAVGFFSYDIIRYIEDLPDKNPDDLNVPDVYFMLANTLLAFDHVKHKILVISNAIIDGDPKKAYSRAVKEIDVLLKKLHKPLSPAKYQLPDKKLSTEKDYKSNLTLSQYEKMLAKAKQHIYDGDIFQVVLSQRFSKKTTEKPFTIYRRLRMINPSPYMFYLKFNTMYLVGSSPEILVRLENGTATLRPIAGTTRRGATREEDATLEKALLSDEKERAEHVMLVDLGRNDLGRVCEYNSVKTSDFMTIERYSHVIHIVSNVEGKINPDYNSFDLLRACFPAGTVSGAPKVRAMEIIDNLEPTRRGHYAGAVGYFDFAGNMDTGIIIRTMLIKNNTAYIQVGSGIVMDSDPAREHQECINKAKPLLSVC